LAPALALAQLQQLKPGWNPFSLQQNVQLGQEASAEVERQMAVVHNRELDVYLSAILHKLEQSPYTRNPPLKIRRTDLARYPSTTIRPEETRFA
jgi:hypothetical protein